MIFFTGAAFFFCFNSENAICESKDSHLFDTRQLSRTFRNKHKRFDVSLRKRRQCLCTSSLRLCLQQNNNWMRFERNQKTHAKNVRNLLKKLKLLRFLLILDVFPSNCGYYCCQNPQDLCNYMKRSNK